MGNEIKQRLLKAQQSARNMEETFAAARNNIEKLHSILSTGNLGSIHSLHTAVEALCWQSDRLKITYGQNFVMPGMDEIDELVKKMDVSQVSTSLRLKKMLQPQDLIKKAMKAMNTPWLNTANIVRSVIGFSAMQNLGAMIHNYPPFDDRTADILRVNLGDWRKPIIWPTPIFDDTAARTTFYKHQGLNLALTKLPVEAFYEGLSLAGLRKVKPSEAATTTNDSLNQEDLQRNNQAHDRLQYFEMVLRLFIEEMMFTAFGPEWIEQKIPGQIRKNWQDKKKKAHHAGEPERPLIEYADFTDYIPIITCKTNWNAVFKTIFKRPTLVQESFQRLYPIRICTMHARIITQEDELYLWAETTRILSAIGTKE